MAGSNCSSLQEAWGEVQQCTWGEATKWAGWLGPKPPPRDSVAEFNLVLSNTGRVRVYLYIFEICGELMQVVRDKIGNIWAVAATLKYCSLDNPSYAALKHLHHHSIFQRLIFQY